MKRANVMVVLSLPLLSICDTASPSLLQQLCQIGSISTRAFLAASLRVFRALRSERSSFNCSPNSSVAPCFLFSASVAGRGFSVDPPPLCHVQLQCQWICHSRMATRARTGGVFLFSGILLATKRLHNITLAPSLTAALSCAVENICL